MDGCIRKKEVMKMLKQAGDSLPNGMEEKLNEQVNGMEAIHFKDVKESLDRIPCRYLSGYPACSEYDYGFEYGVARGIGEAVEMLASIFQGRDIGNELRELEELEDWGEKDTWKQQLIQELEERIECIDLKLEITDQMQYDDQMSMLLDKSVFHAQKNCYEDILNLIKPKTKTKESPTA